MKFITKIARRVWQDIQSGQNVDIYVTLIIVFVVAVWGFIGSDKQTIVSSAILATLGLISIGLLTNRLENEQIRQTLNILIRSEKQSRRLSIGDYQSTCLKIPIRNEANEFLFLATTSPSTFQNIKNDLEIGLHRGLNAKLIFIEPNSAALKMHVFRSRHLDEEEARAILRLNIATLRRFAQSEPLGKLEVRFVNYLPPYNIYSLDPKSPMGRMYVRLLSFQINPDFRPTLDIARVNDRELFEFFLKQFDLIWNASKPINLENNEQES